MKETSIYFILITMVLILSCAGQLVVKEIRVEPKVTEPGGEAKVFVVLKGSTDKVSKIIATVREATELYFPLNDEGKEGDEKAGDNIWSYKVVVPWEAESGMYHLDFSVYDKEGNELVTKGLEQQSTGRSGTVEVIVK